MADPNDLGMNLFDIYSPDQAASQNAAAALARALRGRQALGMVGAASGDPAIAQSAGSMLQSGNALQNELAGAGLHKAEQALQEKHLTVQEQQLANMMRHQQTMEDIAMGRLGQGDTRLQAYIDNLHNALRLKGIRYNPNSGQFENIAPMTQQPAGTQPKAPLLPSVNPPPTNPGAGSVPQPGTQVPLSVPPMGGKMLQSALEQFGNDFDPNKGRSGEIGRNMSRVNAANRLLALAVDPNGGPRNLTPQQMPELAQGLASLIAGGGAGAQAQIEHLTPQSLRGDWAKVAQWVTNEPQGTGQQAFVQNMIETAKREAGVASNAIQQAAMARIGKHQVLISRNPNEAKLAADRFGYDLDPASMTIKPKGLPEPVAAAPDAQDQAAMDWLKANQNHPKAAGVAAKLRAKGLIP